MKKVFVAAAIIAMFAAVSCKSNEEKKVDEAAAQVEATATEAQQTIKDQAKEAAEGVASQAIDAAAARATDEIVNAINK